MQSRKEQVEALKKPLKLAKTDLYVNNKLNRSLFSELMDVLSIIGKEKIYELTKEVYELLDSSDEIVRETVVTTLGLSTRLHVPEFKDLAYKIWLEDKELNVKEAALAAWTSYYLGTKNSNVLKIIYEIFINESYPVEHRRTAMAEIYFISQEPSNFFNPYKSKQFFNLSSHHEFNQKVDWDEIKTIMKKYAPDALL